MKTFSELADWLTGAAEEFGNPSIPVCQLFVRYVANVTDYRGDDLVCSAGLNLWLDRQAPIPLAISRNGDGPCMNAMGELTAFAARQLVPGVWFLSPSLNIPGVIHAFIVLYDVPDPAPWERRIIAA